MDKLCLACDHLVEDSLFCTNCGARFSSLPLATPATVPSMLSSRRTETPQLSTRQKVGNGLEKAGNVAGTIASTIVGVGWCLLGVIVAIGSLAGGAPLGALVGLLAVVYGVYLIKPGGWKFIIY